MGHCHAINATFQSIDVLLHDVTLSGQQQLHAEGWSAAPQAGLHLYHCTSQTSLHRLHAASSLLQSGFVWPWPTPWEWQDHYYQALVPL